MVFLPNGTVSMPLGIYEIDGAAGKLVKGNIIVK